MAQKKNFRTRCGNAHYFSFKMADPAVLHLHVSAQRHQRVGQQSLRRLAAFSRRSARRKVLLVLMLCIFLMHYDDCTNATLNSVWSFPRASTWWETIVNGSFTLRDWLENFRVSHETFTYSTCVTSYDLVLPGKRLEVGGLCLFNRE